MHIVLLNDDILPTARGGSAVVAQWEREELVKRGHRVTLITSHQDATSPQTKIWEDGWGTIISLYINYPIRHRHWKAVCNPKVSSALHTLFQELQPDVVHAHVLHSYLTYDALIVASRYCKNIFITAHDTFFVSYGRVKGERYYNAVQQRKPYTMHWWEHVATAGRTYNPFRNLRIKVALKKSNAKVIAISNTLKEFLKANGMSVAETIYNGMPLQQGETKPEKERFGLSGPIVLYGGRIREDKGVFALFDAMEHVLEKVPNAQLLLVGDGLDVQQAIESRSDALKKCIRTTGWVDQKDMSSAYAACDVVTTPSIYLDAFNLMNIEGMAHEKPVVGTCFGGTAEIVEDGKTGFVRDPRDSEQFADALVTLLQDKEKAQTYGKAGRKRVEEIFSIEKHTNALLALFTR